ncbi:hypothetical protein M426DRAFT_315915 [Hypoxylon sp. CI-4A]|nr:hypothetical protein M426DRAFT_315915 [Hypoxylon sp. CI-4A]
MSPSPPTAATQFQFVGDDAQSYGERFGQPYVGQNNLSSQPLLTTPIPPFSSSFYQPLAASGLAESFSGVDSISNLPNETYLVQNAHNASWNGVVPLANQAEHVALQPTTRGSQVSLAEPEPMRHLHTDLAVLNADQYGGGHYTRHSTSKTNRKPTNVVVPIENAPNPRKRGRKQADREPRESGEEAKRTRGRPRLETKDQTPTERRRTQIRLAQRAYRNRKESAITDLQAKIDGLKEVNDEISSAYHNLFNYATQHGLLAQAPQFGQQLERLQTLVKKTQEQDILELGEEEGPEGNSDDGAQDTSNSNEETVPTLPEQPEAEQTQLYGGIVVSHEPVHEPIQAGTSHLDPALHNPQAHQYEIITAPTHDNASFGFNMPFDTNLSNPDNSYWAQHPWNRLTGPRTMSFNEWSFARRLHRNATEKAFTLISMPNPPPAKMTRVFGFVMLFETVDQIKTRTGATLDRVRDEPLNYWEHPFHRLGGSGTHFSDEIAGPSSLSGSSTYQSSGFATGPFNEPTTRVRDTLLGVSQYINMSGWEGTWFDSGEVETYLAKNGVVIPTAADLHTIEVGPDAFSDAYTEPHIQLMQTIPPNTAPPSYDNQQFDPSLTNNLPPEVGGTTFTAPLNPTPNMIPPVGPDNSWPSVSVTSSLYGAAPTTADQGIPSFTGFDNVAANAFPNTSSYMYPYHEPVGTNSVAPSRKVVLDIHRFIEELISHATCLGRAPSFRPRDIAASFWAATITE